jgi:hypothetical protein
MAAIARPARSGPGRLRRALKPPRAACVGSLRTRCRPDYRTEEDFDLDLFQITILILHHLVKSLLTNCRLALLKGLVLTLDDRPAYGALALLIAFDASFQRHIEKRQSGRNLKSLCQVEQLLARLAGERCRVHYTKTVQRKSLLYKEMHQGEGL